MAKKGKSLIPTERIERAIILVRDEKVMLDSDLAALYGVETKDLLRAVRRNRSIGSQRTSRINLPSKRLRS